MNEPVTFCYGAVSRKFGFIDDWFRNNQHLVC